MIPSIESPTRRVMPERLYLRLKRIVDLCCVILALPILLPIFSIIGLLIKLNPISFIQSIILDKDGLRMVTFCCPVGMMGVMYVCGG